MAQLMHLAVFKDGHRMRAIRYLDDAKPAIPKDQILLTISERIDLSDPEAWRDFHERALRLSMRYGLTRVIDPEPLPMPIAI